jgi:hypothetical protein
MIGKSCKIKRVCVESNKEVPLKKKLLVETDVLFLFASFFHLKSCLWG